MRLTATASAMALLVITASCDDNTPPVIPNSISVQASTTGTDLDPDGYLVSVDDQQYRAVGANGTITFTDLPVGSHSLELSGVASNCSLQEGSHRTIAVRGDSSASTTFEIDCNASERNSSKVITGIEFDFSTHQRGAQETDNWPATWSDDGHQYAFGGDGWGFCDFSNKRSWMVARIEGKHDNYRAIDRLGGDCAEHPTSLRGKTHGSPISIGGIIYFWFTPGSGTTGYTSSTLYRSTDKLESVEKVDGVRFTNDDHSIAYMGFVNHGQDNAAGDGYVYAVGIQPKETSNIFTDRHDHIHLLRVPEDELEDQDQYEWFWGFDGDGNPTWGAQTDRVPTYTEFERVGPFPQMVYVPDLDRYVLTVERGETSSDILVLEGPRPWGPWSEVLRQENWGEGIEKSVFQWQFAPKWFRNGGQDFTLIFSGDDNNDSWNTVDGSFRGENF